VIAANSPSDCFDAALEAFPASPSSNMTPVISADEGGIGQAAEPWLIPDVASLPKMEVTYRTDPERISAYARDENLARAWVSPRYARHGTSPRRSGEGRPEPEIFPLSHSIIRSCAKRVPPRSPGIAKDFPPSKVEGPAKGDLLVIGWGSTYGSIAQAWQKANAAGKSVAFVHLPPPQSAAFRSRRE